MPTATATAPEPHVDQYPSRSERRPELLPRRDPVVYRVEAKANEGPLSEAQLAAYERSGFLTLPGVLSPAEITACRSELDRLCNDETIKSRSEAIVEPQRRDLRSLFSVHRISPLFAAVASDRRIAGMARQILGSEVYLHQSRVNLKPGFVGKEFYWHSDFETWHVEDGMPQMRAVSCSILLTPNNHHNGPLLLVPGSHRHFVACVGATPDEHYKVSLKRQEYGVPDAASLSRLVDDGGIDSVLGDAGTVVLFDCNTMHGSNSNISPWPRSNLFYVFNSVENRLQAPYCGLPPRPEHIASRDDVEPIDPHERDWSR